MHNQRLHKRTNIATIYLIHTYTHKMHENYHEYEIYAILKAKLFCLIKKEFFIIFFIL